MKKKQKTKPMPLIYGIHSEKNIVGKKFKMSKKDKELKERYKKYGF